MGLKDVPRELLEALAAEAPIPPGQPPPMPSGNGEFKHRLDVARWLSDRGRLFRIKPTESRGRTVYVLAECPFDPGHAHPDSCVMQAEDGQLSAKCLHSSCSGRGWKEFKAAIGPPDPDHYDPPLQTAIAFPRLAKGGTARRPDQNEEEPGPPPPLPEGAAGRPAIQWNRRQLPNVTADALSAIVAANDPPTVFQRCGILSRLQDKRQDGHVTIQPLVDAALRGHMARVADWFLVKTDRQGRDYFEADAPGGEVVSDLANLGYWPEIPQLETVVESPIFDRTGRLLVEPGYHAEARAWLQLPRDFTLPPIPPRPSLEDVVVARDLLLVEMLGDFPFKDDASRAHALAALLTLFVREMIDGPTPLILFDAPVVGTGKGLMVDVVALVALGYAAPVMAEASSDDEWRKRITAALLAGNSLILLDNISRTLDSGPLAAVLTSTVWRDRLLGLSEEATVPNRAVWLASGNNTRMSRELIRRTLWCRLDAKVDAPWERTGFRHPNLKRWVRDNRPQLVAAALTLVQAWLAEGRPKGAATLGSFESWVEVVGGILEVAGVPGLLGNAQTFRATHADKVGEWRAFVSAWWQAHQGAAVGVRELFDLVTREKLLDDEIGDKGERSQRIRLGKALGRCVERVFDGYRIEHAGDDHSNLQRYRLTRVPNSNGSHDELEISCSDEPIPP